MRRAAGQALWRAFSRTFRRAGGLVHLALRLLLLVAVLAMVASGALAWRLAQGPLALPWFIPAIEAAIPAPYRLQVAGLALAWEGRGGPVDRPLDLRLSGVVVRNAQGAVVLETPAAEVSLSVRALLRGEVRPRAIAISGLGVRAGRRADGSLVLDLGSSPAAPSRAPADDSGGTTLVEAVLAELARAPGGPGSDAPARFLSDLRRLRLVDANLAIDDRRLATTWHLRGVRFDLARPGAGGFAASAALSLVLGDRPAPRLVAMTARVDLPPGGRELSFAARLPAVVPAELAAAAPPLAPLAAVEAPLSLVLAGRIDTALTAPAMRVEATLGRGLVHVARGVLPVAAADIEARGTLDAFDLEIRSLDLAPPAAGGGQGPLTRITGRLHAARADGRLAATLTLALDRLDFADLAELWPEGVGGPGTRPWLTENITRGTLTGLTLDLAASAAPDLSNVSIGHIALAASGHGLTVYWLRPVPPIVDGEARISMTAPDAITIDVLGGEQALADPDQAGKPAGARPPPRGAPLRLSGGKVVLSGLTGHDQFADITGEFAGPVAALLTVLGHSRLHLLDRRPLPLANPEGQVTGRIGIAHLPLKNDLDIGDVRISASGRLTGVHLGGIVAGHDLDRGMLDLTAGNDGLTIAGSADLAGIPSKLTLGMDFRAGPPGQVIERATVEATPSVAQLARLGLDAQSWLTGAVGLDARYTSRRDGAKTVAVVADLAPAGLALAPLNWHKPVGRPASASARVQLQGERVRAIEALSARGPGLEFSGGLAFADGRPARLEVERLALGPAGAKPATDLGGSLTWPARPGAPWVAVLNGPSLDAGAAFAETPTPRPKAPPRREAGPPWQVTARLGRVLTAGGEALSDVRLTAQNDGRGFARAELDGATTSAGAGRFRFMITPGPGGRVVSGAAADAGGLLRALGVAPDLYGGRLILSGRYDDPATRAAGTPGDSPLTESPLAGQVTITDFRLKDAPFAAKLLQALSIYGIVSALTSRDLGISKFASRYRLADDTLTLSQARAFNASLGITADGKLDLAGHTVALDGTIVPAYLLNSLLGHLPLIGRLLSPEQGGGVIAMSYSMRGPFADPAVRVNPLSVVTPGFLRGLFDIFDDDASHKPPPRSAPGGIPDDG